MAGTPPTYSACVSGPRQCVNPPYGAKCNEALPWPLRHTPALNNIQPLAATLYTVSEPQHEHEKRAPKKTNLPVDFLLLYSIPQAQNASCNSVLIARSVSLFIVRTCTCAMVAETVVLNSARCTLCTYSILQCSNIMMMVYCVLTHTTFEYSQHYGVCTCVHQNERHIYIFPNRDLYFYNIPRIQKSIRPNP